MLTSEKMRSVRPNPSSLLRRRALALLVGVAWLEACSLSAPSLAEYARTRPTAGGTGNDTSAGNGGETPNGGSGGDDGGSAARAGNGGSAGQSAGGTSAGVAGSDEAGASSAGAPAVASASIEFGGSGVVRVQPSVTDDFTIEFWLKTKMFGPGNTWYGGAALFDADAPNSVNDFGSSLIGDKFAFGTGNPDLTILSTSSVNTGVWTHVAATRVMATGVLSVFVNGALETSQMSMNLASLKDAVGPCMGAMIYGNGFFNAFVGNITEVRLWNVARTQAEIAGTMKQHLVGNEANLVGYWRFDDGSGLVAKDSSASHNDGVLGNGRPELVPTWSSDGPDLAPATTP